MIHLITDMISLWLDKMQYFNCLCWLQKSTLKCFRKWNSLGNWEYGWVPWQYGVLWNELVLTAVGPLPFCPSSLEMTLTWRLSALCVFYGLNSGRNWSLFRKTNKGNNILKGRGLVWFSHKEGRLVHYTVSDLDKVRIQMKRMRYEVHSL